MGCCLRRVSTNHEPIDSDDQYHQMCLPLDVFPIIFRHSTQDTLYACIRVCKSFHHTITTDEVLLARLQVIHSYPQFRRYLEVGKAYFHAEYYTRIGQNDKAKFPYYEQWVVTKLTRRNEPVMHMSCAAAAPKGEPSKGNLCMLVAEEYMGRTEVYGVNKFDVMVKLMQRLWEYVNDPNNAHIDQLTNMNKNMRKAIKMLKRYVKKNPKFREFAVLQAGHTEWFQKVMHLRREEEPETSEEDEPTQEMAERDVGKVPTYFCKKCKWRVGGFTCQSETIENEPCGRLLVVQHDGTLRCPNGCGQMSAPLCCRGRFMKAQVDATYTITATATNRRDVSWKECPIFSCKKCKFGVDGIRCYACTPSGLGVERNLYFLRVGCAYVWTCPNGCGRKEGGGVSRSGFILCKCQEDKENPLAVYGYVKKHGRPRN